MPTIEMERDDDGRWIAEVADLPGVMAYGATELDARLNVATLALRVIADRLAHHEPVPGLLNPPFSAAVSPLPMP